MGRGGGGVDLPHRTTRLLRYEPSLERWFTADEYAAPLTSL